MSNSRKWTIFGYSDMLISVCQLFGISASGLLSVQFYFKNKNHFGTEDLAPAFNLRCAELLFGAHIGQIVTAWRLIKAGNNNARAEEWNTLQKNWATWNTVTLLLALIWTPLCGFTILHGSEIYFPYFVLGVVTTICVRAIQISQFHILRMEAETTGSDAGSIADAQLEHPIEMEVLD